MNGVTALIDADTPSPRYFTSTGYPAIRVGGIEVHLHRWVAERVLGRKLKGTECVHHINYNKQDCRRSNLLICPNQGYHKLIHARTDYFNVGVHPDILHWCSHCKKLHLKTAFAKNRNAWAGINHICREASNKLRREAKYGVFNWKERLNQQYRRLSSAYTKREICWLTKEGRCL